MKFNRVKNVFPKRSYFSINHTSLTTVPGRDRQKELSHRLSVVDMVELNDQRPKCQRTE
jgi:hypothetical protein